MVNVQQQEMRRNELNPTVQDSKRPRPGDPHNSKGGGGRPVPPDQVSPYGPAPSPVGEAAAPGKRRRQGEDRT
jgi:hypothetical protein